MSRRLALIEGQRAALAYSQPEPSLWRRIRTLEQIIETQTERIRELESTHAPNALRQRNARRQAESERLQAAIATTLTQVPHREVITAKEALRALARAGWTSLPSVRTVQRHLDALRHTVCGVRNN